MPRCDNGEAQPPAQHQLPHDRARLDGLAEADIVGDQQIDARQLERLSKWQLLILLKPDA